MQFEILSHAGLAVTSGHTQIVCDPWIIGSTYWRSWWNYPPPPPDLLARLHPTHIYLTHIHWDHFQGVTLRRFPRSTPILIPRAPSPRLLNLFNFYEYDLIPLHKLTSPRFVGCWLRRWRELALYASIVANRLRGKPFEFADYLPLDRAVSQLTSSAPTPSTDPGSG